MNDIKLFTNESFGQVGANTLLILDSLKTGQRMSKNRLRPFLRKMNTQARWEMCR